MTQQHDNLVDLIYTSVFDVSAWRGILAGLTELTGARGALLQAPALPGSTHPLGFYGLHNLDEEVVAAGVAEFGAEDPFSIPMFHSLAGRWDRVASGFRSCDMDALERNGFWVKHCAAMETGDLAGLSLYERADMTWPIITVAQQRGKDGFDDDAIGRFQALAPHLRLAARLRFEATLDLSAAAALDGHATACLLLGSAGEVLFANRAARRLDAAAQVIALRKGRVFAAHLPDDALLQLAIHRAVLGDVHGLRRGSELALASLGGERLAVMVAPLGGDNPFFDDYGPVRAAVYLLASPAPDAAQTLDRRLKRLFGLTAAEAQVARDLMDGQAPDDIAQARERSVHTVRAQVRAILGKAGLRRVGDLQALRALAAVDARPAESEGA